MAMTACSAKVCSNATWLSVKPPISPLVSVTAPIVAQQRQRYLRFVTEIANGGTNSGHGRHVGHMNGLPVEHRPASDGTARRDHRKQPPVGFIRLGRAVCLNTDC